MEERLLRHIYHYVEEELRSYPDYKKLIAEYDKDLEYSGAKSGLSKDPSGRFSQGQTSDPTQNEAVRVINNSNRIQRQKDIVLCIDDVLETLSEEDKAIIDMRYFQGYYTDYGIMKELRIPKTSYYRSKRVMMKRFARRMRLI